MRRAAGSVLFLLLPAIGSAQTQPQSASDLIKHLTYQDGRPGTVLVSCGILAGIAAEDRATAQSLVKLGDAAEPELDTALDSIGKQGNSSKFAAGGHWLLHAFAKIKGPAALPRLRKMIGNYRFGFLDSSLDSAAASALGITSYVSSWRQPIPDSSTSCEGPTPRQSLDRFILAWERKDHERRNDITAVGYRFNLRSPWPESAEAAKSHPLMIEDVELDTAFKTASGKDCGRQHVKFFSPNLTIDSADATNLTDVIARCAANP